MEDKEKITKLLEKAKDSNLLDLSSDEDLAIAIMNLIAIEEHLFFTSQKTGKKSYLNLLNEVRLMRAELLKRIIKDYEGEVWCISKHLLAASMRVMEVGTKELKKGNKDEAWKLFEKSYKLYSLFWGINLKVIDIPDTKFTEQKEKSVFDKFTNIVKKALDCCRE